MYVHGPVRTAHSGLGYVAALRRAGGPERTSRIWTRMKRWSKFDVGRTRHSGFEARVCDGPEEIGQSLSLASPIVPQFTPWSFRQTQRSETPCRAFDKTPRPINFRYTLWSGRSTLNSLNGHEQPENCSRHNVGGHYSANAKDQCHKHFI